jgi:signal transduction histidine kinase
MRLQLRPTVRVRLAALLLTLVVIAGVVLLTLTYVLLQRSLAGQPVVVPPPAPPVPFQGPSPVPTLPGDIQGLARLQQEIQAGILRQLITQSEIALVIIAVVSAVVGWVVAGRVLRPLHHITETARRLSQKTLHERIGMNGPRDELRDLADTFDEMLSRLDVAFQSQSNFVANVSHELRTPLTLQRTLLEVALADPEAAVAELRETMSEVSEVVEEQERLIESLLFLAISERGLESRERVDLEQVVAEVVESARRAAAEPGIQLRDTVAPAVVPGRRELLARMVANLVENGVHHNIAGGWVQVSLGTLNGMAKIVIVNSGVVVAADRTAMLFEPFRRLGRDRVGEGGYGLGLSIVRAIVHAHDGRVTADPRPAGGLQVVVELPLAPPPPQPSPGGGRA